MEQEIKQNSNICPSGPENTNQSFEKHWFCAAICKDGKVVLQDSDSPAGFLEILQNSVLAWVDYRTADLETDIRSGAALLGFSDQLVTALADNPRLLYEDYEIEMGIKLPSIQIRINDNIDVQSFHTLLLLRRNFILTIHPILVDRRFTRLRRYSNTILTKVPI